MIDTNEGHDSLPSISHQLQLREAQASERIEQAETARQIQLKMRGS